MLPQSATTTIRSLAILLLVNAVLFCVTEPESVAFCCTKEIPDCCTENPQAVVVEAQLGQLKLNWELVAASMSPQSSAYGIVKAGSRERVSVLELETELP